MSCGVCCVRSKKKKKSFVVVLQQQQQRSNDNDNDNYNGDESLEQPQCGGPFMRSYPRYRVDLSRVKRWDELQKATSNPWTSIVSSVLRPSVSAVQREYKKRFPLAQIQVIPPVTSNSSSSSAGSFPTCHAMKELWLASANLVAAAAATAGQKECLVVFLDSRLDGVIRNFVELVDWANQQQEATTSRSYFFPVQASYVDTAAVHLTTTSKSSSNKHIIEHRCKDTNKDDEEHEEDLINQRTRAWVQRLLVEKGICPFTKNNKMSGQGLKTQGVPVGRIAYHASTWKVTAAKNNSDHHLVPLLCPLFADTWEAMYDMLMAGPDGKQSGISSILLAAPEFDVDFDFWAGPVFALLEATVVAAQAEPWLGVVCFHPNYAVSDGSSWPGFGHMHSAPRLQSWCLQAAATDNNKNNHYSLDEVAAGGAWQRRTPHATINVLRADQLAAAEQVRSSNYLYPRNIRVLLELGSAQLYRDLERERTMGNSPS